MRSTCSGFRPFIKFIAMDCTMDPLVPALPEAFVACASILGFVCKKYLIIFKVVGNNKNNLPEFELSKTEHTDLLDLKPR